MAEAAYRFNRRFRLRELAPRLASALMGKPCPERLLRGASNSACCGCAQIRTRHPPASTPKYNGVLRRQGSIEVTRRGNAHAVRRLEGWIDAPLDQVAVAQLKGCLSALIESPSGSAVNVDHGGLRTFYHQVFECEWGSVKVVRPPREERIPDVPKTREKRTLSPVPGAKNGRGLLRQNQ
jgi:hypothetical protein